MSAMPSTRRCSFCTRLVMLSRDKKTVAKHINVKGFCGGSGRSVEEHDRVAKGIYLPSVQTTAPAVQADAVPDSTPKPRTAMPRKRGKD